MATDEDPEDRYPFLTYLGPALLAVLVIVGVVALASGFQSGCSPLGGMTRCMHSEGWVIDGGGS